uniref:Large ribosomal subunit protein bL28c n=1 Tax=Gloeochaete wittrockiana TaxID=38269 RepID=A0A3G1IW49_9EUKA|nr:ribosomal protein L28 [Gloeochaete wittrockiana]ASQ40253.1 ribosomal protein L28 [Gloeochaete wittrockiana]
MSKKLVLISKKYNNANSISHSNKHSKKKQYVNIQTKKIWCAKEKKFLKVKLSTRILKDLSRKTIDNLLKKKKFRNL